MSLRKLRHWILAALLVVLIVRAVATYRVFNDTFDEGFHISAGLEVLQKGTYTMEFQHPPLARIVVATLPYFAGLRLTPSNDLRRRGAWGMGDLAFYWKSLALARAGNLIFAVMLFCFVYLWGSMLYGPRAGIVACAIAVCCPTLLAHASLATLDLAATATILMSTYFFQRWSQQPGWRYALASAAAFIVAVLSKFSALAFLPPIALLFFLVARWKKAPAIDLAGLAVGAVRGLVFCLLVVVGVWAGYGFQSGTLVPPGHRFATQYGMAPEGTLPRILLRALGAKRLPAYKLLEGVIELASHNVRGDRSYLLGHTSQRGWWFYFPVAVAVKATLPMLLLAALGTLVSLRRTEQTIYPLLGVAVMLGLSMTSHINIGVRHVLPIFPFLAILGSGVFTSQRRAVIIAALALVAWHVGESVAAHPDYLAYFNEITRGRGERFLADSNLDWGQDLARLARYTKENHISEIYLSYFGRADPIKLGVPAKPLHSRWSIRYRWDGENPGHGWVAVSVSNLVMNRELAWLRDRQPTARVGKSIWVYYLGPVSNQ